MLYQVCGSLTTTAAQMWHELELSFNSTSRARTMELRSQLQVRRDNLSIQQYFMSEKKNVNHLTIVGDRILKREVIMHIL